MPKDRSDVRELSDIEIVRRVMDGDVNAFEALLIRYKNMVLKIVSKHVPHDQVEDIAHDVLIRAYKSLSTFKEEGRFRQWLSAISIRTCCDFWRKYYKIKEMPMSNLSEKHQEWFEKVTSEHSNQSFYEYGCRKEAKELLDWALRRLSANDRIVVELVYLEGLSGKEAADLLGWTTGNVKIRLFRARKKLQNVLEKLFERQGE